MSDSSSSPAPIPEPRKQRRLVPDQDDAIEVSGQRLVRARAVRVDEEPDEPAPAQAPTLEAVVQKHLGRVTTSALEDEPEEAPIPAIHDLVDRFEVVADGEVILPHPEADPERRHEVMTVSPIIGTDDAPDYIRTAKTPTTILDLFSMFPELDGVNQYIYVNRKDPKIYAGRKVAGMQRPITRPISLQEWQFIYGGGTYELIVYGPPKRAGVMRANGQMNLVKLTDPITVVFPGIPSFESEVYDGDDFMTAPMQAGIPPIPGRRGPASMADAQIEKERLSVDAAREIRQETHVEKERSRADAAVKEKEKAESALLTKFMELQDKAAQREAELRAQQVEREREIAEERRENDAKWEARIKDLIGDKKPNELDQLAKLHSIVAKPDNSEALREQHARELERINITAKQDADRAADRLRAEQERCDRRIAEEQARANDRIRDMEKRQESFERELRERCDREMQRTKDECDRRVSDMHQRHSDTIAAQVAHHAAAMTAETRNHEREMNSLKAQHAMAMETQKGTYEMRLETARGEVKRTGADVERWKSEAEKNKDPVAQIKKIKENAAELGMVEASEAGGSAEPETIPQMLGKAAIGVAQNLPGIIENVGNMFKGRSAQELQQQRLLGRQEMIDQASQGFAPQALPPPHARRRGGSPQLGGYVPRHMSEASPTPVGPGADPFVMQPQHVQFQAEAPRAPELEVVQTTGFPVPQQQPPQGQGFTNMPPEPQMSPARPQQAPPPQQQMQPLASIVPTQTQSVPPPSAQTQPGPAPVEITQDRDILQVHDMLLQSYTAGAPAAAVAESTLQQAGLEFVQNMVSAIDAERVILAIQRTGDPNSPFLRRDGKKYLRALFEELVKRARPGS